MKTIITGASGFVGKFLSPYLKNDYHIVEKLSLRHENWVNEIPFPSKAIVHLAGKAHDLKKTSQDEEYYQVNTNLTITLFEEFLKNDCEVFIYLSSIKAVADVVEEELLEDVDPKPVTVYGKSKLAAEQYILSKEIPDKKRVYILRPCMIHGPNNKGNLNLLYDFVSKGFPYPFGKYENKRSFVSVENLCFIINEIIKRNEIESGVYNIADDESLSTNVLVKIIGEVINKPAKIFRISKSIISIVAKIGDVIPIPINSERVQKLTENYIVSNKKIKKAIQKELPLSSREGIEKTIASFQ